MAPKSFQRTEKSWPKSPAPGDTRVSMPPVEDQCANRLLWIAEISCRRNETPVTDQRAEDQAKPFHCTFFGIQHARPAMFYDIPPSCHGTNALPIFDTSSLLAAVVSLLPVVCNARLLLSWPLTQHASMQSTQPYAIVSMHWIQCLFIDRVISSIAGHRSQLRRSHRQNSSAMHAAQDDQFPTPGSRNEVLKMPSTFLIT